MKRIIAMLLAALLACAAIPALASGGEVSYDRLVQCAVALRAMAYGDFMTLKGVPDTIQGMAMDWTAGIDDTPDLVVRLDVYGSAVVLQYKAVFKSEHPMVSMEAQSTGVGEIMNAVYSLAAYEYPQPERAYNQFFEVHKALNFDEIYADPTAEEGHQLYLLLYENAEPLFILVNAENGAVSLTPYIVPSMELANCESYAQVAMWFMRWGCPMVGEEVRPE